MLLPVCSARISIRSASSLLDARLSIVTTTADRSDARISMAPSNVDSDTEGLPLTVKRFSSRSTNCARPAFATDTGRPLLEPQGGPSRPWRQSRAAVPHGRLGVRPTVIHQLPAHICLDHVELRIEDGQIRNGVDCEDAMAEEPELTRRRRRANGGRIQQGQPDGLNQRA